MAEQYDLLIRGGTLVDGTGAPARRGDLAVRGGRIAALGDVRGTAARTIDADGAVVAPGFVDIHTHYDVQVFWDRMLSISPWHGVTSVVMGNCGFAVAPTRPAHRDLILRTLENVEGMSLDALRAGLGAAWPFETIPEYLDVIEQRGSAINVAALVGHTAVRLYVMGEEATERAATVAEIAAMRALVLEGLRAGAIGFASSHSPTHVGYAGRPVPSRAATVEEIVELASTLAEVPHGVTQVTIGPGFFLDELAEIQRRSGKPVSWTALLGGMLGPEGHRYVLARSAKLQADGVPVIPQVSCRPLMFEFQFKAPFPLETMALFKPVSAADREGKKRIYADPEFRRALREESSGGLLGGPLADAIIAEFAPEPALEERRLRDVAAERGVHPIDLALDFALATDLEARFRLGILNTDEAIVAELLTHPASMIGLSDAGAHASQLCDAGAPTELLGHWVRDKGVLSLEEGVRRLTSQPADVFGIQERGRLAAGLAADVVVFDPRTIGCGRLRRVRDFPAGADRLVADASGIRTVIVNGTVIRQEGRDALPADGPLPGRLLRGGRA